MVTKGKKWLNIPFDPVPELSGPEYLAKIKEGDLDYVITAHIPLALSLAADYPCAEDLVGAALYGVVHAVHKLKENGRDDTGITKYIRLWVVKTVRAEYTSLCHQFHIPAPDKRVDYPIPVAGENRYDVAGRPVDDWLELEDMMLAAADHADDFDIMMSLALGYNVTDTAKTLLRSRSHVNNRISVLKEKLRELGK